MGTISRSHSFTAGEKPTEAQWNVDINQLITLVNGNLDANNVDATAIATVASSQTISARKTFTAGIAVDELVAISAAGAGDIKLTEFRWDPASGTLADGDGFYISLVADNDNSGEEHEYARILVDLDDVSNASEDSSLIFYTDVAGTLTAQLDISSAGVVCTSLLKTEDTTEATTTTDGSLQTDGGLSIAKDAVFGDDVKLLSDSAVLNFGADSDITVTHVADTGLTVAGAHANGTNLQLNNTASDGDAAIQFALSGTVAYTMGVEDGDSDKFVINYGTGALGAQPALEINTSGNTTVAGTLASGAFTSSGIIKTDDATEATSTTDGSLQTDGGLSVVKDVVIGDDLKLLSDSAVLSLGDGSDATLTHDGTTGVTIAANPITVDSGGNLTLDAHTGILIINDAGSEVLRFTEGNSGDVTVKLATNGKDLVFTDNGDATNMKILDAAAGINVPGEVQTTKIAYTDGDDAITIADGGGVTTSSTLTIGTVAAAGSDTDKFLVLDGSGNVDYRTGTQVLSDIGGSSSGVSLSGSTNNTVATVTGANALIGEANLTFDGTTLAVTGTVEPAGDTAADDNAAIGYTSAEGLILTGQGSTNDVTIKNDADAEVLSVPTGTQRAIIGRGLSGATVVAQCDNLVVEGSGNTGMSILADGTTNSSGIFFGDAAVGDIGRILYEHQYNRFDFFANSTKGLELSSTGTVKAYQTSTASGFQAYYNHSTYNGQGFYQTFDRAANSGYNMLVCQSNFTAGYDNEFVLRGDGEAYADGSWNASGADYQEYFESSTDGALEVGKCVVLDGEKIRVYVDSDNADSIIGVVRPKADNKNSAVVGNCAWNHWTDKYLTDDWGVYVRENRETVTFAGVNGNEVCYYSDSIPLDDEGVRLAIPDNAVRAMQSVRKLNPAYNEALGGDDYSPREVRDEWNLVGMLGQVQVKSGETVPSRWIKMKTISGAVDLYLVR